MLQGLPPSLPSVAGEVNQGHHLGGGSFPPIEIQSPENQICPGHTNQSFSCSVSHIPTVYIVED